MGLFQSKAKSIDLEKKKIIQAKHVNVSYDRESHEGITHTHFWLQWRSDAECLSRLQNFHLRILFLPFPYGSTIASSINHMKVKRTIVHVDSDIFDVVLWSCLFSFTAPLSPQCNSWTYLTNLGLKWCLYIWKAKDGNSIDGRVLCQTKLKVPVGVPF